METILKEELSSSMESIGTKAKLIFVDVVKSED